MTDTTVQTPFIYLKSDVDTKDGRLTKNKVYAGFFIVFNMATAKGRRHNGLRFLCSDNTGRMMTFNPYVFKKLDETKPDLVSMNS